MNQSRTVSMLLALSALTLIAGAALIGAGGVVVFIAGFALGWVTSAVQAERRQRRRRASDTDAT